MGLKEDLTAEVRAFAVQNWGDIPNGYVVPTADSLTFANTGIHVNACVLYADLHRSTEMVDSLTEMHAAERYKAFLKCAAKIIKANDGTITAYDGDRVMGIYLGADKATRSIKTAFELNYAVQNIINPIFLAQYAHAQLSLRHTVGIDFGQLLVAKVGVRVDSDLVWVGPAAN